MYNVSNSPDLPDIAFFFICRVCPQFPAFKREWKSCGRLQPFVSGVPCCDISMFMVRASGETSLTLEAQPTNRYGHKSVTLYKCSISPKKTLMIPDRVVFPDVGRVSWKALGDKVFFRKSWCQSKHISGSGPVLQWNKKIKIPDGNSSFHAFLTS